MESWLDGVRRGSRNWIKEVQILIHYYRVVPIYLTLKCQSYANFQLMDYSLAITDIRAVLIADRPIRGIQYHCFSCLLDEYHCRKHSIIVR